MRIEVSLVLIKDAMRSHVCLSEYVAAVIPHAGERRALGSNLWLFGLSGNVGVLVLQRLENQRSKTTGIEDVVIS